jgi:hypothetical protein
MKREWFTLHIHLGYRYDDSPIIRPDGTSAPNDAPMTYTQTARPGSRAPHVWLAPGKSTLDLFGRGFVLFRFDLTIEVTSLEAAARDRGVPLEVIDLDNLEAKRLYERNLVLIRPDGFVGWRADALSEDAGTIIDTVRGSHPERCATRPPAQVTTPQDGRRQIYSADPS